MFPVRFSVVTYNIWNTVRWPQRKPALDGFLESFRPDLLCVQELREETCSFLDQALPQHTRVHDSFPGWVCESNIYWSNRFFDEIEHGAEDVGILEQNRRLFWVRLRLRGTEQTILVSTAHFTYQENPQERETGLSPRVEQARRTVGVLDRLIVGKEPAFFMGDLNDPIHPTRILRDAGYLSCFAVLTIPCPSTFPCYPTVRFPTGGKAINQTTDWLFSNQYARPIAAQVPHFYFDDMAPSDHWPILAVYEI